MPRLRVSLPDGPETAYDLTEDVVTVGRVADNTIQIDDASVSSHHAELTLHGTDYVLRDLGSTNGTRLNGASVAAEEEHRLQPGAQIRFGSIEVRYVSDTDTEAEPQPMPTETEPMLAPASTSVAPADFANASPFTKKKKERDPASAAVLAIGVLAILVAGAAIAIVTQMQPPAM